jgi:hypothetical protein
MTTNTRLHLKLSLPRPEFLQHHKKSLPLPPTPEENEEYQPETLGEEGDTAEDATEWIKTTIREQGHWEEHLSLIRIDCPHTMSELRRLGRLSKGDGTRQCRKMIRMPVLYDEIGYFLWRKLAVLERGPDFEKEDEERAAEHARGMAYHHTLVMLDERFCFEKPAALCRTPSGSNNPINNTSTKSIRPRQDSEPVSPKHIVYRPQLNDSSKHEDKGPINTYACNFCQSPTSAEHPGLPADIPADALAATRGRIVENMLPSKGSPHARLTRSLSRSSSRMVRPTTLFSHSRRSSYTSSLLWRRNDDGHHELRHSSSSPNSDPRRSASRRNKSRDDSLSGRVGSVVGNLGRGVAVAIGGGLAHGYGFAGRADRGGGSFWSV